MPIYVYKCLENEHIFEKKQKFSDPPVAKCPECGSDVRKVINSVGVVFKGSGFYVTDNRGSNSAAPNAKKNGSEGEVNKGKSERNESAESSVKAEQTEHKVAKKPKPVAKSAEATGL